MPTVDPRSAATVLVYTGPEGDRARGAAGAPARDLSEHDIARLAYVRALKPIIGDVGKPIDKDDPESPLYERPDPKSPDPTIVAEVLAELEASGRYAPAAKAAKAAETKVADKPSTKPAGPPPDTAGTAEKPEA